MDAHALLTSQGWRGSGHSLHPTSDQNGLLRPLLVSRKQNNLGVGKKQHKTSDMWWMNAFDKSLKGLNTAEEGKVTQTLTNGGLDMVVKGGSKFVGSRGLYASFIRGEGLIGTITPDEDGEVLATKPKSRAENGHETKEERRAKKAAKRGVLARTLLVANQIVLEPSRESINVSEQRERTAVIHGGERKERRRERRKKEKLMLQLDEDAQGKINPPKRNKRRKG